MKLPLILTALLASCTITFGESFYTTEAQALEEVAAYGDFGMSFKLNQDVSVTELSFFAQSLGGGDTPYVQLWDDDNNTLLASVSWSSGETEAGWNAKKLEAPIELKRGVNYQIQGSAYWVPTYIKREFLFNEVVESTKFYQDMGWTDWTPPSAPSSGSLLKEPAAMVNFSFETK
jgi:hypothetical protein